jgi:hypothetical protein
MIGWQAARANAVPALIIQTIMLGLLIGYYAHPSIESVVNRLAQYKRDHGLSFVLLASITAGALIPELFVILFFQRGRPHRGNLRNLLFTVPVWI